MLSDLDTKDYSVVLLQSSSSKMNMYVQDKLKLKLGSNIDTTIDVSTNRDFKKVHEITGLVPPFSDKWYVIINYSSKLSLKDLEKTIESSSTCVFLVIVNKYIEFKSIKTVLKGKVDILELYLSYLRRVDLNYLYVALVPNKNRLSKQLFDYVASSYSNDIESVFDLFIALNEGRKVESRGDIAGICGIGNLTIESFLMQLLRPFSYTEKGFKKIMKNRMTAGRELGTIYKFPTFYAYLKNSTYGLIQVKMLKDTGKIYKSIRNLPDCYEQTKLARYQKYMWELNNIPLSRLVRLIDCMGSMRWRTELDFINFLYNYYRRSVTDGSVNLKEIQENNKLA